MEIINFMEFLVVAKPPKKTSRELAPGKSLNSAIQGLDFDPAQDQYKIVGAAGIATIHVKKPTGEVLTKHVNGVAFKQLSYFDPSSISVEERRDLEHDLVRKKGLTQSEAADLLGVSQSLIAKDLKILDQKRKEKK